MEYDVVPSYSIISHSVMILSSGVFPTILRSLFPCKALTLLIYFHQFVCGRTPNPHPEKMGDGEMGDVANRIPVSHKPSTISPIQGR